MIELGSNKDIAKWFLITIFAIPFVITIINFIICVYIEYIRNQTDSEFAKSITDFYDRIYLNWASWDIDTLFIVGPAISIFGALTLSWLLWPIPTSLFLGMLLSLWGAKKIM